MVGEQVQNDWQTLLARVREKVEIPMDRLAEIETKFQHFSVKYCGFRLGDFVSAMMVHPKLSFESFVDLLDIEMTVMDKND
jgi:hypothetical protein